MILTDNSPAFYNYRCFLQNHIHERKVLLMKLVSDYVVHALVQDQVILILILDIVTHPETKLN